MTGSAIGDGKVNVRVRLLVSIPKAMAGAAKNVADKTAAVIRDFIVFLRFALCRCL